MKTIFRIIAAVIFVMILAGTTLVASETTRDNFKEINKVKIPSFFDEDNFYIVKYAKPNSSDGKVRPKEVHQNAIFENGHWYYHDEKSNSVIYWYGNGKAAGELTLNEDGSRVKITIKYPNGSVYFRGEYSFGGLKTGVWEIYREDGTLISYDFYEKDVLVKTEVPSQPGRPKSVPLTARWVAEENIWHDINWQTHEETNYYKNGALFEHGFNTKSFYRTGQWKGWHENGTLRYVRNYIDGKRNGEFIEYYPDGKIEKKGFVENNMKTGEYTAYYPDGKLKQKGIFTEEFTGIIIRRSKAKKLEGERVSILENGKVVSDKRYLFTEGKWFRLDKDGQNPVEAPEKTDYTHE